MAARVSRRVWLLAAVAAALGVAVAWPTRSARAPALDWTLPALAEITRLEIRQTGREPVVVERSPAGWRVGGAALDPYVEEALQSAFGAPVRVDLARPLDPAEVTRYGLGEHAPAVTLVSGAGPVVIQIGKVVDGRRTFITSSAHPGEIFRATANLRQVFDRPAESWPDRRLFDVTDADIATVTSARGPTVDWRATRARPDAPWQLVEPAAAPVDGESVAAVVHTLVSARATRFIEGPITAERTVTATTFGGRVVSLALSAPHPDGSVDVRVPQPTLFAQLPAHLATFLRFDLGAVRERRVFLVDPAEVVAVDVQGPAPATLVRDASGWRLRSGGADRALTEAEAEAALGALVAIRAAGEPPAPAEAFAEAFLRVVVRTRDDRQLGLIVGAPYNGGARFAKTSDDARPPFVLGASTVARLAALVPPAE